MAGEDSRKHQQKIPKVSRPQSGPGTTGTSSSIPPPTQRQQQQRQASTLSAAEPKLRQPTNYRATPDTGSSEDFAVLSSSSHTHNESGGTGMPSAQAEKCIEQKDAEIRQLRAQLDALRKRQEQLIEETTKLQQQQMKQCSESTKIRAECEKLRNQCKKNNSQSSQSQTPLSTTSTENTSRTDIEAAIQSREHKNKKLMSKIRWTNKEKDQLKVVIARTDSLVLDIIPGSKASVMAMDDEKLESLIIHYISDLQERERKAEQKSQKLEAAKAELSAEVERVRTAARGTRAAPQLEVSGTAVNSNEVPGSGRRPTTASRADKAVRPLSRGQVGGRRMVIRNEFGTHGDSTPQSEAILSDSSSIL